MSKHRSIEELILSEQREFNKRYLKQMERAERVIKGLAEKLDKGLMWEK